MNLIIYLLKLLSCSAILTGYYYFFLRNRNFHMYNRYFLLLTVAMSVVIPFVQLPDFFNTSSPEMPAFTHLATEAPSTVLTEEKGWSLMTVMPYLITILYFLVMAAFLFQIAKSVFDVYKLTRVFPSIPLRSGKLFLTSEPGTPFSFFRWIFWNTNLDTASKKGQQVLQHELYHVTQKHSFDTLYVETFLALFWWNPFFYFIKKELMAIHEFLADKAATNGENENEYAELLLLHAISEKKTLLTHTFFQNQIKRRIVMLTEINKTRFAYIRRLMSLPMMFIVCLACSRTLEDKQSTVEEPSNEVIEVPKASAEELHESGGKDIVVRPDSIVESTEIRKTAGSADTVLVSQKSGGKDIVVRSDSIVELTEIRKTAASADTVLVSAASLEKVLALKSATKNISSRSVGKMTYMTFDEGPVYAIPTAEMQAWQSARTAEKPRVSSGKRSNLIDSDQTFTKVEIQPAYPGGVDAWMRFLNKTFRYPQEAVDKEIQGTVVLQFIVERDGSLSEVTAVSGHEVLKTEALRVIKESGKWLPAVQDGVTVRSYKKQPITFRLQSE